MLIIFNFKYELFHIYDLNIAYTFYFPLIHNPTSSDPIKGLNVKNRAEKLSTSLLRSQVW